METKNENRIVGYKGFDKDLRCLDMQYEVGGEYKKDNGGQTLELCTDTVYHYCGSLRQVFDYYPLEFYNLGTRNSGNGNQGDWNTGDNNDGTRNSGSENRGSCNSGERNIGDGNTGSNNSGNANTGHHNFGAGNTGSYNEGHRNSGSDNNGYANTGDRNVGHSNTGSNNSGNRNTGNGNTGDGNTGKSNAGSRNTGICNVGDDNTGSFNRASGTTGFFCTEDEEIRLFNKPSGMTCAEFQDSIDWPVLEKVRLTLNIWEADERIDGGKGAVSEVGEKEVLRKRHLTAVFLDWWSRLSPEEKEIIVRMPNFDAAVFREITGISVDPEKVQNTNEMFDIDGMEW